VISNEIHYDKVTQPWTLILGENLHYGYFTQPGETLEHATHALVETMARLAPMNSKTSVLDVGCGIGTPAFHLVETMECQVTGISISGRGIAMAEEACKKKGLEDRVKFFQRDALNNQFSDSSFDVAWVMESSHLMRDKHALCSENHRVLREGGSMLLCDLMLKKDLSLADIYKLRNDLLTLERSFGKAKMETFQFYEDAMRNSRFERISSLDISKEVFPTLDKWEENLQNNLAALKALFSDQDLENFSRSCEILKKLFTHEVLGYGIVTGQKGSAAAGD
jgi:27-O-demethylrifamycin SV methyltransferase